MVVNPLCAQCRGACCEVISVDAPTDDHVKFYYGRMSARDGHTAMLDCRCRCLMPDGKCAIESVKPKFCVEYEAGGKDCRLTVRLLRPALAKEWGWL